MRIRIPPYHFPSVPFCAVLLLVLATSSLADEPASGVEPVGLELDWGEMRLLPSAVDLTITRKPAGKAIEIPRLNNRIGAVYRQGDAKKKPLNLKPLVKTWSVQLPPDAEAGTVIIVETKEPPQLPENAQPITPNEQGDVVLPAHAAVTHGKLLRFEPQPHKNTVGYWANVDDWCEWNFKIDRPGRFTVHVLQGCGKGHGGSEVDIVVGDAKVSCVVEDTGHFQNFKPRNIGEIEIKTAGEHSLQIRAKQKPGVAVMDVREVRLQRQ